MHTKAKWVTFIDNGSELFFKLDDKGNLIKTGKEITPDHSIPVIQMESNPEPIQEPLIPSVQISEEIPFTLPVGMDSFLDPLDLQTTDPLFDHSFTVDIIDAVFDHVTEVSGEKPFDVVFSGSFYLKALI